MKLALFSLFTVMISCSMAQTSLPMKRGISQLSSTSSTSGTTGHVYDDEINRHSNGRAHRKVRRYAHQTWCETFGNYESSLAKKEFWSTYTSLPSNTKEETIQSLIENFKSSDEFAASDGNLYLNGGDIATLMVCRNPLIIDEHPVLDILDDNNKMIHYLKHFNLYENNLLQFRKDDKRLAAMYLYDTLERATYGVSASTASPAADLAEDFWYNFFIKGGENLVDVQLLNDLASKKKYLPSRNDKAILYELNKRINIVLQLHGTDTYSAFPRLEDEKTSF